MIGSLPGSRREHVALSGGVVLMLGVLVLVVRGCGSTAASPSQAAWSPDGRQLAYTYSKSVCDYLSDPNCQNTKDTMSVRVRNVNGSGDHQLVANGDFPSWSPDGKRVAFLFFAPNDNKPTSEGIAVFKADGSHLRRVLDVGLGTYLNTQELPIDDLNTQGLPIDAPAWSPDGRLIAYGHDGTTICVVRPDGTGRRCFDIHTASAASPTWSPDSRQLAFLASKSSNGNLNIALIGRDGRGLTLLHECCQVDLVSRPAWSHGDLTAYGAVGTNCLISARTGAVYTLNTSDGPDFSWSPDDKRIAYSGSGGDIQVIKVRASRLTKARKAAAIRLWGFSC
jgi:dipeptidyl aminopeptidase/acylaminoacyl peptidase